ncbi:hypothetical protein ACFLZ1_01280 [Patescibacteria group bacterium]
MMEPLRFSCVIKIADFPVEWLPLIQLFDPYLPQFPVFYIHKIVNNERIYGFPVFFDISNMKNRVCDLRLFFLSNKDIEKKHDLKKSIKLELSERLGLVSKITLKDIINSCNGDKNLEDIMSELWNKNIKEAYGDCLPFGKFYEELYSIIRFTAAFNPSSGRKSEMQMVYDFISNYGEGVSVTKPWSHLEYYILPTYNDLLDGKLDNFPKFKKLYNVMMKFFKIFYTEELKLNKGRIKLLPSGTFMTTSNGDQFRAKTENLRAERKITSEEKETIDLLLDAFNRYPPRVRIFITFICNINCNNDYRHWNIDDLKILYLGRYAGKGMSPKVLACFMQQGFGDPEFVPIDNWIEAFYSKVLNINNKEEFLDKFSNIGKLERLFWILSQARKTNSQLVFDQLWCIKYGTPDNKLRGPNPLSCFFCTLRNKCLGYNSIKKEVILITEDLRKIKLIKVNNVKFIIEAENKIPKKVYTIGSRGKFNLIDIYTGYFLHGRTIDQKEKYIIVKDFISNLQD